MEVQVNPLHKQISHLAEEELVSFTLSGREENNYKSVTKKRICFLIDVSGSMQKYSKLIEQTLDLYLKRLREEDEICIILFSNVSCVVCKLNACSEKLIEEVRARLKAIKFEKESNLSNALLASLTFNNVDHFIVLTDNCINGGILDTDNINKLLKIKGVKDPYHTIIFGTNSELIINNGKSFAVKNLDDIQNSFLQIIGNLQILQYQNVSLTLQSENCAFEFDSKIVKSIMIDDVYAGKEIKNLITVLFLQKQEIYEFSYAVRACSIETGEDVLVQDHITLARGDDQTVDKTVLKMINKPEKKYQTDLKAEEDEEYFPDSIFKTSPHMVLGISPIKK